MKKMNRSKSKGQLFALFFMMATQLTVPVYAFEDGVLQTVVNMFISFKEVAQHDVEVCKDDTSTLLQTVLFCAGLSMIAHACYRYHTLGIDLKKATHENPAPLYDPLEILTFANNLLFVGFEYSYYILRSQHAFSPQERNISSLALTLFYLSNGRWCKARSFFKERRASSSGSAWYEDLLKVVLCVPGGDKSCGNKKKYLFFFSRSFLKIIDSFLVHAQCVTDPARIATFINFDATRRTGYD